LHRDVGGKGHDDFGGVTRDPHLSPWHVHGVQGLVVDIGIDVVGCRFNESVKVLFNKLQEIRKEKEGNGRDFGSARNGSGIRAKRSLN